MDILPEDKDPTLALMHHYAEVLANFKARMTPGEADA